MKCVHKAKTLERTRVSRFRNFEPMSSGKASMENLTDENSLSAQILKTVYFPCTILLEVELGLHPSQIWRAILDRSNVLRQGFIRRIGDGWTTNI